MIAATVHFYGFYPFSVNVAGVTTYDEATQQDLENTFQRTNDTFVDNGVPVIVGEWGVLGYDYTRGAVPNSPQYGELLKFFQATVNQAVEEQLTLMLWDAGSYLNRNTLEWRDPLLKAYMDSGFTTLSGTASFDSIYLEKAGTIADESLTLNRNGLDFEGLWQGDTALTEGDDYTVSGDTLTLTAAALTRLAGDRAHGTNATIEARFSDGLPWADPHHHLRQGAALGRVRDPGRRTLVRVGALQLLVLRDPDRVQRRPGRHDGGQVRRRHQRRAPHVDRLQGVLGDLPARLRCRHDQPHP